MDVAHDGPNWLANDAVNDDADQVTAARNVGAFDEFYRRELPAQVRRAAMLVGDPHSARDLVHDAFLEVFSRWEQLREPGPYLQTAVLNRCRDRARRQQRWGRPRSVPPTDESPPDEGLWDALQKLPFNHRAALTLRYHNQYTNEEIAEALGCPIGSVGPWIQRGLRRLRKDLS